MTSSSRHSDAAGEHHEMTFLEHLEELRHVIIRSVIALLVALAVSWFTSKWVLDWLIRYTMPEGIPVVFLSPAEAFVNQLKVALAVALMIALPYIASRMWQFIVPGLLSHERKMILPLSIASTILFYLGILFAFLTLVPIVIKILLAFGTGNLVPTIAIGYLLAFVLKLCLACGLVFQMPLVIAVLTHLGLVTPEWLLGRWRYAVLIIFLASAVMTPADAASQLILGLPVTGLFFLSVGVSKVIAKRRVRRMEEEFRAGIDDRDDADDDDEGDDGDDGPDDDGGGGTDDGGRGSEEDGPAEPGVLPHNGAGDAYPAPFPDQAVPRTGVPGPLEIDDTRRRGPQPPDADVPAPEEETP